MSKFTLLSSWMCARIFDDFNRHLRIFHKSQSIDGNRPIRSLSIKLTGLTIKYFRKYCHDHPVINELPKSLICKVRPNASRVFTVKVSGSSMTRVCGRFGRKCPSISVGIYRLH